MDISLNIKKVELTMKLTVAKGYHVPQIQFEPVQKSRNGHIYLLYFGMQTYLCHQADP